MISNRQFSNNNTADASKPRAKCVGCEDKKLSRTTRVFKSLDSLRRHVERCDNYSGKKGEWVTRDDVKTAIKNAQKKFGKDVPFGKIPEFYEWGVLVK